jgi:hypothetical protein
LTAASSIALPIAAWRTRAARERADETDGGIGTVTSAVATAVARPLMPITCASAALGHGPDEWLHRPCAKLADRAGEADRREAESGRGIERETNNPNVSASPL